MLALGQIFMRLSFICRDAKINVDNDNKITMIIGKDHDCFGIAFALPRVGARE